MIFMLKILFVCFGISVIILLGTLLWVIIKSIKELD